MLGDKAYDSAELHEQLRGRGTKPVIPNRCNRKRPFSFSKRLYKLRWRIESAFNRLKDFRRIASPSLGQPRSQHVSASWASEVFSEHLLQCRRIQHEFRQELLQPAVLVFQCLQSAASEISIPP